MGMSSPLRWITVPILAVLAGIAGCSADHRSTVQATEQQFVRTPAVGFLILLGVVVAVLLYAFGRLPPAHARQLGMTVRHVGRGIGHAMGHLVQLLIVVPLLVVAGLAIAFFVLIGWTRISLESGSSATVVPQNSATAITDLAQDDVSPRTQGATATAIAPPPPPKPFVAKENPSSVVRVLRAVSTAFASAAKSAAPKNLPSRETWTRTTERIMAIARTEGEPNSPSTDAKPAVAKPAAPSPPAKATAAAPTAVKRPDWVDHPPQPSGEKYEVAVVAGPWSTRWDCEKALDEEIDKAVDDYVEWRLGKDARSQVQLPKDFVRHQLVAEEWLEGVTTGFGEPMLNLHALLRFDPQVDKRVSETWNELLVTGRLTGTGLILGGGLLLLAVFYGYLRLSLANAKDKSRRDMTAA
jgi:hypothetical protein